MIRKSIRFQLAGPPSPAHFSSYRKFNNPRTMALAFSESSHNLKEARLWQECGNPSGTLAYSKQIGFDCCK